MFETLLIQPIYNVFVYLIGIMPGGDVGFAIILLTLLMRILFYPAFTASIRTQMGMQAIQGDVDEINTKFKDDPKERATRTMALFKERNIRPLSGFLAILVQIPVFIALYFAFFKEELPKIVTELLYSFVPPPEVVNTLFLGFVDLLTPHNIILSVLVGVLQYGVVWLSLARVKNTSLKLTPERETAQKMQKYLMLYFLPGLMVVVSYSLPAAAGLYFATTNLLSLGQEWVIRRQKK